MVKYLIISIMILMSSLSGKDAYERNCVPCHKTLPSSLQKMFMRYLLVYSGEENVKAGLKHYLHYPSKDISVMSDLFRDNYGIKKKSLLNKEEMDKAIDIYWEKFKVFGKLK